MNEIYEVFSVTGERLGCTSNQLNIGEEVKFTGDASKAYVIAEVAHVEKVYFAVEKGSKASVQFYRN